jgi:Uma2 family endonuclease
MSITLGPETEMRLPDRYEVINGEIADRPAPSPLAAEVANRIYCELAANEFVSSFGRSRMDVLYRMPLPHDPTRNRRPHVSLVSFARWPINRRLPHRGSPIHVVPDLIVEVVGPTDMAEDLVVKTEDYLKCGIQLIWLVFTRLRIVHAHDSSTAIRVFTESDELDGGTAIPGLRIPVAQLFRPITDDDAPYFVDGDSGTHTSDPANPP